MKKRRRPTHQIYRSRPRGRQGVLILVVLSMLVLFLMMGIAYVLTSGQFHTMSRLRSTARQYMSEPRETMDAGMYQVMRDTRNTRSVIISHSMLNDLYGNDGFVGYINGTPSLTANAGGQLIDIVLTGGFTSTHGGSYTLSSTVGAYAGCVFTVVSGSEVGRSARIVGYNGSGTLTVTTWQTRKGTMPVLANLAGARVVINGRPFNGVGSAYNTSTGKCDIQETAGIFQIESKFLPNRSSKAPGSLLDYVRGGMDESYDAPDLDNMFLAFIPPGTSESDARLMPLPSFHRPDLLKYLSGRFGSPSFPPLRPYAKAMLRPLHGSVVGAADGGEYDFPPLPIGTLTTDPILQYGIGPWDVDNDDDGVRDSVWVDLGFPNMTTPDGILYRPMFAFLIVDLDNRLNLNAVGNASHYASSGSPSAVNIAGPGNTTSIAPRGDGLGVAEINLAAGTSNPAFTATEYRALLEGNGNWPGRYGFASDGAPGVNNFMDGGAWCSLFGLPQNYYNSGYFSANMLGRPVSCRGRLAFGLDYRGVPVYEVSTATDDRVDSPYEIDLSRNAPRGVLGGRSDAPFSVNELERLLRPFDRDARGLPSRLNDLAPSLHASRFLYTTESFSLPVPTISVPRSTRTSTGIPYHIVDLLQQRLTSVGGLSASAANTEIYKQLPPELIRGERFDLNRLFGNGIDNNGNNVVDDPGETSDVLQYPVNPTASSTVNANFDFTQGAANVPNSPLGARQLYARYLYCLAMLLKDASSTIDFDGDGSSDAAETARGLAQWAINAADFRDSDSIMTPFEYDPNPFNGWEPDGDLTTTGETDRGVVWGAERPELLITETLAWHDRATQDSADDPTAKKLNDTTNPDTDFDQRFRPKGPAFIELYNPWAGGDKYPAELYDLASGAPVLNLNRVSNQGNSPVWRVLVVEGASRDSQATVNSGISNYNPYVTNTTNVTPANVARSIYFTSNSANFSSISGHGTPYYPSNANLVTPIRPGQYAVVGSSGRIIGGNYVSTVGHLAGSGAEQKTYNDTDAGNTRQVSLSPNSAVNFVKNNGTPAEPAISASASGTAQVLPTAAIVIDSPNSFSISEPDGTSEPYYAQTITDPTDNTTVSTWTATSGSEGLYNPPADNPLDAARQAADSSGRWDALIEDGTKADFRTIHLQRLANPLVAWNAVTNPYITIDVSPMNLTVFNGSDTTAEPGITAGSGGGNLSALQRGNAETSGAYRTLWRHELAALPNNTAAVGSVAQHVFNTPLSHTLGYLNKNYGYPAQNNGGYPNDVNGFTFPWLTWNNRPYLSPAELLLVPKSSVSRLAYDYLPAADNPITAGRLNEGYQTAQGKFGHLINFFDTRASGGTHMYRLLDYVGTPTRFAGVRELLNPSNFGGGSSTPGGLRTPMNYVSSYREPGRININTVGGGRIWETILGNHYGPTWNQLVASRRGYGSDTDASPLLSNTASPSYFGNPFRAFGAGDLVAISSMEKTGIDATLFRSYPNSTSASMHTAGDSPLMQPQQSYKYNQADRNPYFRYHEASRISNMVTTQSNVFAVWVTMGYFKVQQGALTLQREIGVETNGGTRHRAFYIIDRSIPVAFEPGENHNVDDAILVRRMLD